MELQKYKQHRKLITVICDYCGNKFLKPESEYNRNTKLGRKNYCSRHCCGKAICGTNLPKNWSTSSENIQNLNEIRKNIKSCPFKSFLRRIRSRNKIYDITAEYLEEVWNQQKGLCPYSGISLVLPKCHCNKNKLNLASLDRIDSSKGYIKGNVQFVALPINYLKSTFSDLDVKCFLKKISNYTSTFIEDETISSTDLQLLDALVGN